MIGVQEITILSIFLGIIIHRTKFSPSSKNIFTYFRRNLFSLFEGQVLCRDMRMWRQIFALKI